MRLATEMNIEGAQNFRTTHWSVVLQAGGQTNDWSAAALENLCRTYWYPLYAYVRRRGHDAHQAQDLTQEFFAQLLERRFLDSVRPEKGKFRSFLIASMNNFLANEWNKSRCIKRGGNARLLSLDDEEAEQRFLNEPADKTTPEGIFDKRWAETVLEQVIQKLREEMRAGGHSERFEALRDFLVRDPGKTSYAEVAEKLGLSVSATTSAIFRLRTRFRELFRREIAHTVASPDEVEEEIRYLIRAL